MIWIISAIMAQLITMFIFLFVLYIYIRIDEYFFYKKIRKYNDKNKRKD